MESILNMLSSLGLRWWQHVIVRGLHEHCITAEVIDSILIPRIQLCPSDPAIVFRLCRRRFSIKIAFAVTVSKAKGQTLKRLAIFLPSPVFPHGQLYVAFSRSSTSDNVAAAIIEGY
jgi:hypothetical protein